MFHKGNSFKNEKFGKKIWQLFLVFERYKVLFLTDRRIGGSKMIGQEIEYRRTYASEIPRNVWGLKKNVLSIFSQLKSIKSTVFFGTVSNSQASTHICLKYALVGLYKHQLIEKICWLHSWLFNYFQNKDTIRELLMFVFYMICNILS